MARPRVRVCVAFTIVLFLCGDASGGCVHDCLWRSFCCVALEQARGRRVVHALLFARAGEITRVYLWVLNRENLYSFRSVSRLCVRRLSAFVISPPFADGAATAFPISSPKKKKRGCRQLVIIRGSDGAATVPRERFRTHK